MIEQEIKCPEPSCDGVLVDTDELRCNKCKEIFIEKGCPNSECEGLVLAMALGGDGACPKCGESFETSFDTNFGTIFEE